VTASGTASGTRIGAGLFTQDECVDPVSHLPKFHIVGEAVLTAANGDLLIVGYEGLADPVVPPAFALDLSGTFEIAGGTGRFADATGSGSLTVTGTANGGDETAVFEGTIRR
jgi:hypothetical protein